MASLRVVTGELAGTTVEVTGELVIGRADADLTLDDAEVSRRHAIVRQAAGKLQIEDLGSSNGTFVDGARIAAPTALEDGSKLTIGTTELVVNDEQPVATTVVSAPQAASLRVVTGELAGTTVEVTGELLIGRADADLTLDDAEVSRRHAIVRQAAGKLQIEDLGSSNGTFVDGARIAAPTALEDGSKLTIGTTELVVESHAAGTTKITGPVDPNATKVAAAGELDSGANHVSEAAAAPARPQRAAAGAEGRVGKTFRPGSAHVPSGRRCGRGRNGDRGRAGRLLPHVG